MDEPPDDYRDILRNDAAAYTAYRRGMIDRGILMTAKNARRNYLTEALSDADVERTGEALREYAD
jgi:glutamate-1-semialdehyde 2,1-aminomutase